MVFQLVVVPYLKQHNRQYVLFLSIYLSIQTIHKTHDIVCMFISFRKCVKVSVLE